MRFGFLRFCYYLFLSHSLLDVNCCGWSRGDSGEEHEHLSDAVLESVMVFRLAAGAVAEVVVPLGLAKAGFSLAALLHFHQISAPVYLLEV